jgi:predicted RNA-binding Zn-ribbon protein involved in translation (DUF1610 family)
MTEVTKISCVECGREIEHGDQSEAADWWRGERGIDFLCPDCAANAEMEL